MCRGVGLRWGRAAQLGATQKDGNRVVCGSSIGPPAPCKLGRVLALKFVKTAPIKRDHRTPADGTACDWIHLCNVVRLSVVLVRLLRPHKVDAVERDHHLAVHIREVGKGPAIKR
eukprot:6668617-Prymnesium_polylepis.1